MTSSKPARESHASSAYVGWSCALAATLLVGNVLAELVTTREAPLQGPARVELGARAPSFSLTSADGEVGSVSLDSKRPTILFFLCGCPPCIETARAVRATVGVHNNRVDVFGITSLAAADAKEFRRRAGFEYPILLDSAGEVAHAYRITRCPVLWHIDKDARALSCATQPALQRLWLRQAVPN